MTVYTGKPDNIGERLPKEAAVYQLLEELEIPYQRVDHEPLYTVDACQEVDKVLNIEICKNLFLCNSNRSQYFLLMMPGEKKLRTRDVAAQIQSTRLSFAGEEKMVQWLGITPGSVSVMGLMNDRDRMVRLLIDRDLLDIEYLGCHPCVNTSSLKLLTRDVLERFLPAVGHGYTVVDL